MCISVVYTRHAAGSMLALLANPRLHIWVCLMFTASRCVQEWDAEMDVRDDEDEDNLAKDFDRALTETMATRENEGAEVRGSFCYIDGAASHQSLELSLRCTHVQLPRPALCGQASSKVLLRRIDNEGQLVAQGFAVWEGDTEETDGIDDIIGRMAESADDAEGSDALGQGRQNIRKSKFSWKDFGPGRPIRRPD